MRIRKKAKISTLLYTNTDVSNVGDECLLQKNLCQLNQSPWDIITFPSSNSSSSLQQFDEFEVYCNANHAGNGSSNIGSIGDYERKITLGDGLASTKTLGGENDKLSVDPKNDFMENLGFGDGEMNEVGEELILLCDVRDEKGWQCGRVVKNGETMCDHHAVWTTKKKPEPVHESKARRQSRQTKKRASTSPYEFYYYSGFGPTWGKKRGEMGSSFSNSYKEPAKVAFDDKRIKETSLTKDDTGIRDDEDDIKKGKTGKKRGRKPMKARSLKSLM